VLDATTHSILRVLADGATTAEAAVLCNVSESTLRRKLAVLRDAWHIETTTGLVVHAVRRGLA
jgi:DeoR/GlpR family transcriptional regulator of sugar metabolism